MANMGRRSDSAELSNQEIADLISAVRSLQGLNLIGMSLINLAIWDCVILKFGG